MTYTQKSTWPNLTGKAPKEGSIRDVHQRRKEARQTGKAAEKEMWKDPKYQDQSVIDKSFEASEAFQEARQTRGEEKGWSQRKMERKGLETEATDIIKGIPGSGREVGEKRVPKYNVQGELIGYKVKPGGGKGSTSKPSEKDAQYFYSKEDFSGTNWGQYSGKTKRDWIKKYKQGKTSANLNKGEIDKDVKKDAENIKLRDTLTKKGRAKLRTFYLKHDATPGEMKSLKKTTDMYYDPNDVTPSDAQRTTTKEKQSIYSGIKKKK
jgi:hypothetical protein